MDSSTFAQHMPIVDAYPRPDWNAIDALIATRPESELHTLWCAAARTWLQETARHLGKPYEVTESPNFLMLMPLGARQAGLVRDFTERAWNGIGRRLEGLGEEGAPGKCVVMLFADHDAYYEYAAPFHQEGEYPLSSGMFLNAQYGHVAMPFHDIPETEATLAHELTHCFLRSWPIPLWLNEGLAVTMENELCGNRALFMDPRRLAEHQAFWNAETMQEFWSGASFGRTDEGNELSYELARYCVRALAHDVDRFIAFVRRATHEDGGEAAAVEAYGGGLGGVIEQFFGKGDWAPRLEVAGGRTTGE